MAPHTGKGTRNKRYRKLRKPVRWMSYAVSRPNAQRLSKLRMNELCFWQCWLRVCGENSRWGLHFLVVSKPCELSKIRFQYFAHLENVGFQTSGVSWFHCVRSLSMTVEVAHKINTCWCDSRGNGVYIRANRSPPLSLDGLKTRTFL